jgi:hypothetical protein
MAGYFLHPAAGVVVFLIVLVVGFWKARENYLRE